jgi:hypothetical protein
MGKAKLNGLLVDRSEITPVFDIAEELSNARARLRQARDTEAAGCIL